ncbi:peptidoglycan bridge formation glycyltransferase FemA/FemB family protein [Arthrobacter sp. I2-34]|uniref:Peptidoglycan bridge formation glycyltransferase FemA/FemB family protein n=1 Tax=Arthrobacter hankyongi TaxID=2904801 RepID=A0ABS9L5R8_9MICC|nr:peptidoglycan bridge formation glycyltransferase FemA/FemB family protein [Arthrobacter hankyongi]MCG2622020.1 peptidoglycan bridge formation glycyltransferase FemA/FemB family protein [Arthrobacter hankyongi]
MAADQLTVRPIEASEHSGNLRSHPHASFLQFPEWANVKPDWRAEILGWFDAGGALRGSVLALHRPAPALKKTLAYLPAGPLLDWATADLEAYLGPLLAYLKAGGAFLVRMGPPLVQKTWAAETVRKAIAAGDTGLVTTLEPKCTDAVAQSVAARLAALGWTKPQVSEDFSAGQPEFQARVPLADAAGQRLDTDAVLARMDRSSRRQIRISSRAGLEITEGSVADLAAWHALYRETAERDGFTGRPASYFERMLRSLNAADPGSCVLYLARHEGRLLAAAIYVRKGRVAWYVYAASSSGERNLFAPRALQCRQVADSIAAGCDWYDLGGLSATLDQDHRLGGLTMFKSSLGGDVVQTLGEWDYPLNRPLAAAFDFYMKHRNRH